MLDGAGDESDAGRAGTSDATASGGTGAGIPERRAIKVTQDAATTAGSRAELPEAATACRSVSARRMVETSDEGTIRAASWDNRSRAKQGASEGAKT